MTTRDTTHTTHPAPQRLGLTIAEAAEMLGCGPLTVRRRVWDGVGGRRGGDVVVNGGLRSLRFVEAVGVVVVSRCRW